MASACRDPDHLPCSKRLVSQGDGHEGVANPHLRCPIERHCRGANRKFAPLAGSGFDTDTAGFVSVILKIVSGSLDRAEDCAAAYVCDNYEPWMAIRWDE